MRPGTHGCPAPTIHTVTNLKLLRVLALSITLAVVAMSCGDDSSGTIGVLNAEFRLTANDLGAGYMTITNGTDDTITLVAVSSPEVGRVELHESMMNDEGVMQMLPRPEGFTVEPGGQISLESGGKHLMLIDPEPTGDELEFTLDFGSEQLVATAAFDEAGSAAGDVMADMENEG